MRDNLYKVQNFVIELDRDDNDSNKESIVVRDIASSWSISFSNNNILFAYWHEAIQNAKKKLSYRKALEATITDLYVLSTLGVHDPKLSNDLCDAVISYNKRVKAALTKIEGSMTDEEKAEDAADNEEWLERQDTIEKMASDVEKEEKES